MACLQRSNSTANGLTSPCSRRAGAQRTGVRSLSALVLRMAIDARSFHRVAARLSALLLTSLVPHLIGQTGSVEVSVETMGVSLPPGIRKLWEPNVTSLVGFAGSERVASEQGCTLFTTRGKEVDRLLLIGGMHCRWARRVSEGTFEWDAVGYVLAGRLPEVLPGEWVGWRRPMRFYVDMLGPADGQVFPGKDEFYPHAVSYFSADESFVIGVPAPGRWTTIINQDGGPAELLATLEAVRDDAVPDVLPAASVQPYNCRVRFDVTDLAKAAQPPGGKGWSAFKIMVLGRGGIGYSSLTPVLDSYERQVEYRVPALSSTTSSWVWRDGWEVQQVEGRAFTSSEGKIDRVVRPGRSIRVRVTDSSGLPLASASVDFSDEAGEKFPAAWSSQATPENARLGWWGKTDANGVVYAHGVPADVALTVRATANGHPPGSVALTRAASIGSREHESMQATIDIELKAK